MIALGVLLVLVFVAAHLCLLAGLLVMAWTSTHDQPHGVRLAWVAFWLIYGGAGLIAAAASVW